MKPILTNFTNPDPTTYITKDLSTIRELLHPNFISDLPISLAEASVNAGMSTEKHRHTNGCEIYYCLSGSRTLHIDTQSYPFEPGDFYLIPKNSAHYLTAKTPLRLLCICHPAYCHDKTIILPKD